MTAETKQPREPKPPELAADGVQEVALTHARRLLTELITQAREQNRFTALTVRGQRKIVLVTPEWYERAVKALSEH